MTLGQGLVRTWNRLVRLPQYQVGTTQIAVPLGQAQNKRRKETV
jgi:hypothetical protein